MPAVAVAVAGAVAGSAISGAIAATPAFLFAGGAFAGLGISTATIGSIVGGLAGFAINQAGSLLIGGGSKKKSPNLGTELQTGVRMVNRQSDDTHKIIYGRARVGGLLALRVASNTGKDSTGNSISGDNLFLHMVIVHAAHEVTSYDEIYFDDELVTLDSNGFAKEDKYKRDGKSFVRIKHYYGTPAQLADPDLVAEVPQWTTNHRLRGLAYTYIRLQWNDEIFASGAPLPNFVIKGKKVYDPRLANTDDGLVADTATEFVDYGLVTDTPTTFEDSEIGRAHV
jgi:hypothetical protein